MRILIAEDDAVIADGLLSALRATGAVVDHVGDGALADVALMTSTSLDLLILDIALPRLDGLEVLRRLRARGSNLQVLILSAVESPEDRARALDLGADDYMVKPFSTLELEARVRALGRRKAGTSSNEIRHGPLVYDQSSRVVSINGRIMSLSPREIGLLEVLIAKAGKLVDKDQLVERMCEWGEEVSVNAIEVYMSRLRKKFEHSDIHIVTVRGLGYCLENMRHTGTI